MASQTTGIQQLLAAEKRAAEKVSDARKRKARRLKQAKEEAQAETERYRADREKQFKDYEAKHMGTKTDIAAKIDKDTKSKIATMEKAYNDNYEQVIQFLLTLSFDIKPEMHQNARLQAKLEQQSS